MRRRKKRLPRRILMLMSYKNGLLQHHASWEKGGSTVQSLCPCFYLFFVRILGFRGFFFLDIFFILFPEKVSSLKAYGASFTSPPPETSKPYPTESGYEYSTWGIRTFGLCCARFSAEEVGCCAHFQRVMPHLSLLLDTRRKWLRQCNGYFSSSVYVVCLALLAIVRYQELLCIFKYTLTKESNNLPSSFFPN